MKYKNFAFLNFKKYIPGYFYILTRLFSLLLTTEYCKEGWKSTKFSSIPCHSHVAITKQ